MRAFLSLTLLPFLLVGSALPREPAQEISAALLVYRVLEQRAKPYISRILVTPGYLRMDKGADDDGFILYDRAAHVIYSITPSEQSLLVIDPPKDKPESPLLLAVSEERHDDPQAPAVAGIHPLRYGLKVNGRLCAISHFWQRGAPPLTVSATRWLATTPRAVVCFRRHGDSEYQHRGRQVPAHLSASDL